MAVLEDLDDRERYLLAILTDESGVDVSEFCWQDPDAKNDQGKHDWLFRCYPYQYNWYRCNAKRQIDECARAIGKSVGIQMRAFAFSFTNPGQEMLITAPELIHLDPVTKYIEDRLLSVRMSREMLKKSGQSNGINKRPFEAKFTNGAKLVGRIPQKDGKGVKGCVAAGTLILTQRGQVPVESVVQGDLVLTHLGNWKPVTHSWKFTATDGYALSGGGVREIVVSDNHRMYGRRNRNPQRSRNLGQPTWIEANDEELKDRWYFGSPAQFPALPLPAAPVADLLALLWIAGRYVADGNVMRDRGVAKRIAITVKDARVDEVIARAQAAGLSAQRYRHDNPGVSRVEICGIALADWLVVNFGELAAHKRSPIWLLGAEPSFRQSFLDGYLSGDGSRSETKKRWVASTASKELAVSVRLLAQSLGFSSSLSWTDPKVTHIRGRGLKTKPQRSYRVTISDSGHALFDQGIAWSKVRSVRPVQDVEVYDLNIADDHSYIADGLISHNMHPRRLEIDEGQDYPEAGWIELMETLRYGDETSSWRVHGVSRGVRDRYYKLCQPESGWYVHRVTAMHRPDWSDEERRSKAEYYGSKRHPDYRRNILGKHGDAHSPMFVLHRLMACVAPEPSDFTQKVYTSFSIRDEVMRDSGLPIESLIDLPGHHLDGRYHRFWAGMDVGMTNHPTEILVFGEESMSKQGGGTGPNVRLALLLRVHLERISASNQRAVMHHIDDFYKPAAFSMDRTGLGLPIYQDILNEGGHLAKVVRGYNFSEKLVVGWDKGGRPNEPDYEFEAYDPEDNAIMANVLEYSSDQLRLLVDQQRLWLPWDVDVIKEFQGQTYTMNKSSTNPYGKKEFNKGRFHALDAVRMAVLGYVQSFIEPLLEREDHSQSVMLSWLSEGDLF